MPMRNILFTDGEGPIVWKDLAFDLTSRVLGKSFFALISLYDDYLTEINKPGYQAGDTLALIVPHLLFHCVTDEDITQEADTASLIQGVREYVKTLRERNWDIRIISTAYRPMWNIVGGLLGIPPKHIACTEIHLDALRNRYEASSLNAVIAKFERGVSTFSPLLDPIRKDVEGGKSIVDAFSDPRRQSLLERLDTFYWNELPSVGYHPLEEVQVIGGRRKVEAALRFANELGTALSDIVYVGDSITDDALFAHLKQEGGLPVAINGNEYALRNARVAAATTDMRALLPLLFAWERNGFDGVCAVVDRQENDHLAIVNPSAMETLIRRHKETRRIVRREAAKLG